MKLIKGYFFLALLLLAACHPADGSYPNFAPSDIAFSGDNYTDYGENPFVEVSEAPVSTFSIDADGAAYANVRRFLQQDRQIPPVGAVRTEELINYFELDYPIEDTNHPITVDGEVSSCPWNEDHRLMRIGVKGRDLDENRLPAANFVFLIDVSGSMSSEDKLELLKEGFRLLVAQLQPNDRVAIVTYAGSAGVVLPSTAISQEGVILAAIDRLGAGGSTAGAEGIVTAYEIAQEHLVEGGNNRIVIGTDGDFNVGPSSQEELVDLIKTKRDLGIFITVLGVGRGNLNDSALEQIANNGNGTYEYIDNLSQLKKVFIYDYMKFFTVAKDVKIQVEFNPDNVSAYRLIGYENRLLSEEDFEDDTEDAGEIGANQNITAIYELIPTDNPDFRSVPAFTIDTRYKQPDADESMPYSVSVFDAGNSFAEASDFMKFTASISAFSMLLTDSSFKGDANYDEVIGWLEDVELRDAYGFKSELRSLMVAARGL